MDRFRRLDLPIVVTVLFAVLVTAMAGALHQVAVQSECIQLVVASSQEKSTLMQAAAAAFNAKRLVVGGRCINVNVNAVISGAAEQALVDDGWNGQPGARPDVWVPSATTWLQLLDEHRSEHGRASLFARDKPAVSIMQSPLVIAMPEPMARALGWPNNTKLGWKTIFDLARDPRGWAAREQKWGAFRLGKTNPYLSTSGLNTLINTYYAASGKTSNLNADDLSSPDVSTYVKDVESTVAHYGDTATTFLTNLRLAQQNSSQPYVSAVAVEEKEVWNYNVGNVSGDPSLQPASRVPSPLLAAIYPSDGTIRADHPYAVLTWATRDKRAVSDMFLGYLLSSERQVLFQAGGFRDSHGDAGSEISTTNRLNPANPIYVDLPTRDVIARIQASWDALRKPARILIVADVSSSVGAKALADIKRPLADALVKLSPRDQVGLWQAPGRAQTVDELVAMGSLGGTQVAQIHNGILGLKVVDGQASLVDVVVASLVHLRQSYDPRSIDAIVLLSPGTKASLQVEALLQDLSNQPTDQPIHVFTVHYGNHPDQDGTLRRIAGNSGAGFYDASSPGSFNDLMIRVLSNF
jgi:Ca-activated chloride channel family protein